MKKVLLLSSVIIILGLTGCSNKYFNDWFSSEQNETDKMCQQIIEACKQQDSEKLKSLFSEESKKNIENLDTEISAFFDYIEGSIQSFEGDCASSSESNYGKRKTELDGMYLILTEKERYCMNFYMYILSFPSQTQRLLPCQSAGRSSPTSSRGSSRRAA